MADAQTHNSARHPPPAHFSFKPEDWPRWIARYGRYRRAVHLDTEDAARQVDALLWDMGEDSEEIFTNFGLTAEQAKDYDTVVKKFTDYYTPKRNRTFERQRFHDVEQGSKTVEEFERELYAAAKYCEFVDKEDQICDQFVRGLTDIELKQNLCLKKDLKLADAVTQAKQTEHVKRDLQSTTGKSSSADEVQSKPSNRRRQKFSSSTPSNSSSNGPGGPQVQSQSRTGTNQPTSTDPEAQDRCSRCGYNHGNRRCPASGQTCNKCKGRGHFAKQCFSNVRKGQVQEVTQDYVYDNHSSVDVCEFQLDTLEIQDSGFEVMDSTLDTVEIRDNHSPWFEKLKICGKEVLFKVDSGADVTVVSEKTYLAFPDQPPLQPCGAVLHSPGGKLSVQGSFVATIHHNGVSYKFRVIVVSGNLSNNLLSRSVSNRLGFIKRADEIGLLNIDPVHIELKEGCSPFAVHTARNIGFHLLPKVEDELKRMEKEEIIKKIETPTDWCAPMVPIIKPSGKVRICTDFKQLNQNVKRPYINLPNLEDIAPKLVGATYFSTMDANSGFHQIPLAEESMPLTTFITPFGRFCYKRLPMGINIGPEVFQLQMQKVLQGLSGCTVIMDDILVWGTTLEEHNRNLMAVKQRITESGLTLNEDKCQYGKKEVKFFGHLLSAQGLRPSPEKVDAILQMPAPRNVTELRSLCGMLNYLSRFTDGLATAMKPMTDLLKSGVVFLWGSAQQMAFKTVKQLISRLPSLSYFDIKREVVISADASSYGLGGVLLQYSGAVLVPIAFASRALTDAERRYSQIEKECLAATWACERFRKYIMGLPDFELWTDHKPLVPLIAKKPIDQVPLRCQRLLIRLMQFNPVVSHKPGKQLVIADALSRNPVYTHRSESEVKKMCEIENHVDAVMSQLPISTGRMAKLRQATVHDSELADVINYVVNGWPVTSVISPNLKVYHEARDMLSVVDGLLVYQHRVVVPRDQRLEILGRLHESHQGFQKCWSNALRCVWWPGIRGELKSVCESCMTCLEHRPAQRSEPLIPTPIPSRPWEKIGADLCSHDNKDYLILIDYYSRWLEIKHLGSTSSAAVINKCRQVFATFGIPDEFHCDNGPQFVSGEFKSFADDYGFALTTSSPYFAQANGEAESAVKIAKNILSTTSPDIALLNYRTTQHSSTGVEPSVALMGRVLNTRIPVMASTLVPKLLDDKSFRETDAASKARAKFDYDRRHGARPLKPLALGDPVLVRNDNRWKKAGVVVSGDPVNRTYLVNTDTGVQRRNRAHLLQCPGSPNTGHKTLSDLPREDIQDDSGSQRFEFNPTPLNSPVPTPTRVTRLASGCSIKKPARFVDE